MQQGSKERHTVSLRLMEKLLGEQRWKLQALPVRDRWTGHQCVLQGEQVHSTRRGHVRPGSPRKSDTGGGDLEIPGITKAHTGSNRLPLT